MRDSGSGWSLGPELDHFSSRTRHLLQYMNPNKINMDLILDILEYLGNITHVPHYDRFCIISSVFPQRKLLVNGFNE